PWPGSPPTRVCGWMWDPKKSRRWRATLHGWPELARQDPQSDGAPPRTSRIITLPKKSPGNTGGLLVKTERLVFRSHPKCWSRSLRGRKVDQVRRHNDQRLANLLDAGGFGERAAKKRNSGKPGNTRVIPANTGLH